MVCSHGFYSVSFSCLSLEAPNPIVTEGNILNNNNNNENKTISLLQDFGSQ